MRNYITKKYTLSIDFLDYSKNNNTSISIQNKDIIYNEKDTNTAFIEADLFADGDPINLNGYDKVVVGIKKSDGLRVQNDCVVVDSLNGKIEIPFTTQSLASVGVNYFDITLYNTESELVSPKFSYRVMEAMINDDTLESSNEFGTLVMLIEKTEELLNRTNEACDRVEILEEVVTENESVRNSNEDTRKSNETSRVNAENTRKANETTRVNSENSRVSAENSRVTFYNETVQKESIRVTKENERIANETTRVSSESTRVSSENTRKSNETTRISSETSRVNAESTRHSNETGRVSAENIRKTNEANREITFATLSNNMTNTNNHWDAQFQGRYDNLNEEYAELVDSLDKDVLVHNSSEDLLNENVTSFKVGTGKVNGVDKDYSSQMEQSLVTVYDLEGNEVYHGLHSSNDTITLGIPITSTHKVQLNTKAQVEEMQEVVQKEKKSVWERLRELFGFKLVVGDDKEVGYAILPNAFGGLIIQWGKAGNTKDSPTARFNFPIVLSDKYYFWHFSPQWSNSSDHYWVSGDTDYKTYVSAHKCINAQVIDDCRFLIVGK